MTESFRNFEENLLPQVVMKTSNVVHDYKKIDTYKEGIYLQIHDKKLKITWVNEFLAHLAMRTQPI